MMNVHPSIHTTYYRFLSPEDAIHALIKGGFHHGDFNYAQGKMLLARGESREKTARDFKLFLDDVCFSVSQTHLEHLPDLTLQEVVEALHEINYSGVFNLEVDVEMAGNVPKAVLDLKLVYLKDLVDMMVAPDFWKN